MVSEIVDDKSEHCIPFILEKIKAHCDYHKKEGTDAPPFFLGLNGIQGAGKTTLVSALYKTLTSPPHNLPTVVLSIDDLYLPHSAQKSLAQSQPTNPLIQHRGQPSTHDIPLGKDIFSQLFSRQQNIRIPFYDKSAHSGQGDRTDPEAWEVVNKEGEPPVEVVIFEGWCVGFRSLSDEELVQKWEAAKAARIFDGEAYHGRLAALELEHVSFVNEALRQYDALTDYFGALVHIDAMDTLFVYDWRLEQERKLRKEKGTGMKDKQVIEFVNGYYPAYELYTDVLRKGIFHQTGKQLRLVVNKQRRVEEVEIQ
ncbi:putative uridine/cytidine kinase [Aureobasidium pullulans]|uniref:Uridine/cytidine kinase n=1 Tax=Aureobasidium pullulans TaxID=5580 RepID=A0AB74K0Y9_AURPU|nr:putative uridine/cytidine kinase [Aureobasidium pullulans]THX50067.1 putative uridine/cytidine kinase [Aureobasidium pullulans]